MRRLLWACAALSAVILAIPATAVADKPTIEPTPPTPDFVIEGSCEFPVLVHTLDDKSKAIIFGDRTIVTGKIFVRLTNLDTETSIDLNISGPGVQTIDEEAGTFTIRGGGPWLNFLFETDAGGPGVFLTRGHLTVVFDLNTGTVVFFENRGSVIDLCEALAG
jgi:hypothetical protein